MNPLSPMHDGKIDLAENGVTDEGFFPAGVDSSPTLEALAMRQELTQNRLKDIVARRTIVSRAQTTIHDPSSSCVFRLCAFQDVTILTI